MGKRVMAAAAWGFTAVFLVLMVFGCKYESFNGSDILTIINTVILAAAAYFVRHRYGKPGAGNRFMDILWKAFIFLAAVSFINRGFEVYSMAGILKSLAYLIPGIAGIFVSAALFDVEQEQYLFVTPVFINEPAKKTAFKILLSLSLAGLGVFLFNYHHDFLGTISYAGSIVQLFLILKTGRADVITRTESVESHELKVSEKVLSLAMISTAFVFYYLSLKTLKLNQVHLSLLYFLLGSLFFGIAPGANMAGTGTTGDKKSSGFDMAFGIFIFISGLLLFSHRMMDVPPGIHSDEGIFMDVIGNINSGVNYPLFIQDPKVISPSFSFWLLAAVCRVFGTNIITTRWVTIIISSGLLVAVYMMVRELYNRRAAVMSSIFMSCFFMVLLYSRMTITWMYVPAFGTFSLFLLYKGLKKGNPYYFIFSGLLLGFNLYFYNAAKISPLIYLVFPAFLLAKKETRVLVASNWKNLMMLYFSAVLIQLPMVTFVVLHSGEFFGRVGAVSLFKSFPPPSGDYYYFIENILKQGQMFFSRSANGSGHNIPQKPFFDGLTGFFALVGVGYLFFTWKKIKSGFMNIWLFTGMLAAYLSVLGAQDPYPCRVVFALPAIIIAVLLGIERSWSKLENLWPRILRFVMPVCAVFIFAWFAFYNLNNFFAVYKNDPNVQVFYRSSDRLMADYVIKNSGKKILFSPFFDLNYYNSRIPQMQGKRWGDFIISTDLTMFDISRLYDEKKRDAALIGEGICAGMFPAYVRYFPDAKLKTVWDYNFWQFDKSSDIKYCYDWQDPDSVIEMNRLCSSTYVYDPLEPLVKMVFLEIPYADIDRTFSLHADFKRDGRVSAVRDIKSSAVNYEKQYDAVVITGLLYVPEYGKYEFNISGPGGIVYINGAPVNSAVELYRGLNRIRVVCAGHADFLELMWKKPGGLSFTGIPREYMINSDKIYGLIATYTQGRKIIYKELDPAIDYREYWGSPRQVFRQSDDGCFNISWNGFINIDDSGINEFKLDSNYDCEVKIDGRAVFKRVDGKEYRSGFNNVRPGKRPISITAYYVANDSTERYFRLLYKTGEKKLFMPVTYGMLSPGAADGE